MSKHEIDLMEETVGWWSGRRVTRIASGVHRLWDATLSICRPTRSQSGSSSFEPEPAVAA